MKVLFIAFTLQKILTLLTNFKPFFLLIFMTPQDKTKGKPIQEDKKLLEYQKLIEKNLSLAKYIIGNNLTNDEIKGMKNRSEKFFKMILSNEDIQQELMSAIKIMWIL